MQSNAFGIATPPMDMFSRSLRAMNLLPDPVYKKFYQAQHTLRGTNEPMPRAQRVSLGRPPRRDRSHGPPEKKAGGSTSHREVLVANISFGSRSPRTRAQGGGGYLLPFLTTLLAVYTRPHRTLEYKDLYEMTCFNGSFGSRSPPREDVVSGLGQEVLSLITGARELKRNPHALPPLGPQPTPPPPMRICGDPATRIARGYSMLTG
jgi:hypothetical protein